jgi:HEAT repeat protein
MRSKTLSTNKLRDPSDGDRNFGTGGGDAPAQPDLAGIDPGQPAGQDARTAPREGSPPPHSDGGGREESPPRSHMDAPGENPAPSSRTDRPPTGPELDPELKSRLEDIVKQLSQSLKLRSFYPKGHNAVVPAMAELKRLLDAALDDIGELTIGSTGDNMIFDGQPFGEDKRPLRSFAKHLKVRDISGIAFRRGVTDAELEEVLEILGNDPESFASTESPLRRIESQTQHVEFKQVDYSSVLRHVSDETCDLSTLDTPTDVWKSLVTRHLLGDGELSSQACEFIARSAGDKAALEQMTQELVKASSDAGDATAASVARGLAKTCKGIEGLSGAQREHGMANLAEIVSKMDPEVIAHLVEANAVEDADRDDPIQDMTQRLPVDAKLRLLTALVHSQRMDKARLSSVFRRVAGARNRRHELLREMRKTAGATSPSEAQQFDQVCSAVQDLVLAESEERFVGSDYVSMLEGLGDSTIDAGDSSVEDLECLEQFRGSLERDRRPELKARFLIDLARLQEDQEHLTKTMNELKRLCGELCEAGHVEVLAEILAALAEDLSTDAAQGVDRRGLLEDCLKTVAAAEAGQSAVERLLDGQAETAASLEAVLAACGAEACHNVLAIVAKSDAAIDNERIAAYLASHSSAAAEACRDILQSCSHPNERRLMRALSLIGTPEAVETVSWALENGGKTVRVEAVKALASMHVPAATEALKELLAGRDHDLVALAADSLGDARAQRAVPLLLGSLKSMDFFGRNLAEVRHVATALGKIGSQAAVPYLERLLTKRMCAPNDAKKELRKTIALALKNIGGDEALLVLTRNASCYNRQVKEACKWAMSRPQRRSAQAAQTWDDADLTCGAGPACCPVHDRDTAARAATADRDAPAGNADVGQAAPAAATADPDAATRAGQCRDGEGELSP